MTHTAASGHFMDWGNWNVPLTIGLVLILACYFLMIGPFRSKLPGSVPVKIHTVLLFLTGVALYWVASGSPLAAFAHHSFSGHMAQMSILYLVMPPILLLGLPEWLIRPLSSWFIFRTVGSFLSKPLIALFAFNGALSIYHVPAIFDFVMQNPWLQTFSHAVLQWLAFCMWWVIACPIPEFDRIKPLHKLAYICGNAILLTPACALIIFADEPLFRAYANLTDQAAGGVIMKITQEAIFIVIMVYIFFQWVRQERARDEQERQQLNHRG